MRNVEGRMWAVYSSASGTVLIGGGAFWLSFVSLADLARRSGIVPEHSWIWPLLVDGLIVVATVAAVALDGDRAAWYPWTLLILGALVSVAANAIHAVVSADTDMPLPLAAAVASVPPLVLLASTHLTVVLIRSTRHQPIPEPELEPEHIGEDVEAETGEPLTHEITAPVPPRGEPFEAQAPTPHRSAPDTPDSELEAASVPEMDRRAEAARMRDEHGWSNKRIARELGVHASTVGRWLPRPPPADRPEPADSGAGTALTPSGASSSELVDAGTHPPIKEATP